MMHTIAPEADSLHVPGEDVCLLVQMYKSKSSEYTELILTHDALARLAA